ncbi:MAG: DUF3090 family protein [Anaerolineales bacterium]|nr:DUF3090 family protein [Anaerolineales bacterium]
MAGTIYELDPVSSITTGYIGQPGKRVFYLQAAREDQTVTLVIEKMQVDVLAQSIQQFMDELKEQFPNLPEATLNYRPERMHLRVPLDPAFRVGQLGLGYDSDRDLILLVAQEVTTDERTDEEASVARLFATRAQMLTLAEHSKSIIKQGRPICAFCGQPVDPEGHFCPRRNGHKY